MECFGNKYYNWDIADIRKKTKEFFTLTSKGYFGFQSLYYDENEEAFFKLIHNTYIKQEKSDYIKGMDHLPITDVFELVFKDYPTQKNLKIFFSNPVI